MTGVSHGIMRPVRAGYHWMRDTWYESPRPWFRPARVLRGGFDSAAIARQLRSDGLCILPRYLDGEHLARVQREADAVLQELAAGDRGKRDYNRVDLSRHPAWAQLMLDELVLAAFEEYYGRPIYLATTKLQRLEPTAPYEENAFRWHHDTKGKQLKAMWLLTDVLPDGQRMSYVTGSHRAWRPTFSYEDSRFTDAAARQLGAVVECTGPAGSVVLFDTNGIHKGNRNGGPERDVLVGVYTAGRHLHGCTFDPSWPWLTPGQRAVLDRSRTASPGFAEDED